VTLSGSPLSGAETEFVAAARVGHLATTRRDGTPHVVPISPVLDRTYEDPSIVTESAREQAFGQSDHVRIYALDYRRRLEQAGFKVDLYDWTRERDSYGGAGNLHGLNERELLYRVTKG